MAISSKPPGTRIVLDDPFRVRLCELLENAILQAGDTPARQPQKREDLRLLRWLEGCDTRVRVTRVTPPAL